MRGFTYDGEDSPREPYRAQDAAHVQREVKRLLAERDRVAREVAGLESQRDALRANCRARRSWGAIARFAVAAGNALAVGILYDSLMPIGLRHASMVVAGTAAFGSFIAAIIHLDQKG